MKKKPLNRMNITLDDTSPTIAYYSASNASTWITNHTGGDSLTGKYFDGTFHATTSEGDWLSLRFNGTAIYMYGAKRGNHGQFSVSVDGGYPFNQIGYSKTDHLQALLYSQEGLDGDKEHVITMTAHPDGSSVQGVNLSTWWFDFDYAVITTNVKGKVYTTKIDDTSPLIDYGGPGVWGSSPLSPSQYYNTTAKINQTPGASLTMPFNGTSIGLYGGLYHDHGNYSVSIDGVEYGVYNGSWWELETQVPLFVTSNLEDGPHTIQVTVEGDEAGGQFFDFDFAIVNSTIDPTQSLTSGNSTGTNTTSADGADTSDGAGTSPSSGSSTQSKGGSNTGAIAGGVVGGVVGLALIALGIWWFLFRKRKSDKEDRSGEKTVIDLNAADPTPYRHGGHGGGGAGGSGAAAAALMGDRRNSGLTDSSGAQHTPLGQGQNHSFGLNPGNNQYEYPNRDPSPVSGLFYPYPGGGGPGQGQTQGYHDDQFQPGLRHLPPPPPSNATSYPMSLNPPSSAGGDDLDPNTPNPFTSGHSPTSAQGQVPGSAGSQSRSVPNGSAGSATSTGGPGGEPDSAGYMPDSAAATTGQSTRYDPSPLSSPANPNSNPHNLNTILNPDPSHTSTYSSSDAPAPAPAPAPASSPAPLAAAIKGLSTPLPFTASRPRTDSSVTDPRSETNTTSANIDTSPGQNREVSVQDRYQVRGRAVDIGPLEAHLEEDEHTMEGTLPPDYHQATQPLPGQVPPLPEQP